MKWSLSFCAAFFLAVRGDVTFVWESVTNHVIWIVYLINVHYVTIRYINQSYRVDEENSYGSTFLHRLAELVTYVEMRYREISFIEIIKILEEALFFDKYCRGSRLEYRPA